MRAVYLALALTAPASAWAQVALYGAQPPKGSAYVRFVNAADEDIEVRDDFGAPQTLGQAQTTRVGPYAVVEKVAGKSFTVTLKVSGKPQSAALAFTPDSYNTVLLRDVAGHVTATVVSDGTEFNQAKARLSFYNATADCAGGAMTLAQGNTAVFSDVAPAQVKTRSVNPVKADVQVVCTGQAPAATTLDNMEAGKSYSVWLMKLDGEPTGFVSKDITLAYKP